MNDMGKRIIPIISEKKVKRINSYIVNWYILHVKRKIILPNLQVWDMKTHNFYNNTGQKRKDRGTLNIHWNWYWIFIPLETA